MDCLLYTSKDFGNKAQEMTKDIKGKLEEQQAISRLNAQINEAKNQMKNTYMAIGERYYELHKDEDVYKRQNWSSLENINTVSGYPHLSGEYMFIMYVILIGVESLLSYICSIKMDIEVKMI